MTIFFLPGMSRGIAKQGDCKGKNRPQRKGWKKYAFPLFSVVVFSVFAVACFVFAASLNGNS
jgi:hypothetical protein